MWKRSDLYRKKISAGISNIRAKLTDTMEEMLLSKKTSIKVSREYANLIGHMCYAASKLWNVCNYERQHYKETGMEQYPDWYYQKKAHKEDLWYKQLPSQTAQEVCKLLDKAWKSFYALKRSGGIETPRPPRFKQESILIK